VVGGTKSRLGGRVGVGVGPDRDLGLRVSASAVSVRPRVMVRKCRSRRLTEHTLKPTNMYQVEVAHIANV
jgi:hypothetical protein